MLNLLFISNSPKVQDIKGALQPILKVIIDVVPDFDHGLKDVFEKRPATVCIQDMIAGVTGESVARHIQMLLGSGAPTFILMHEGNSKVKPIKGLFDHVIDLNQPEADLLCDLQDTLKSLLGDQWLKIYVPPAPTESSVRSTVSLPPESMEDADKFLDNFMQDFERASIPDDGDSTVDFSSTPDIKLDDPFARSSVDELADMLLAQANQSRQDETSAELLTDVAPGPDTDLFAPSLKLSEETADSVFSDAEPDKHKCHVKPIREKLPDPWQMEPVPSSTLEVNKPVFKTPPKAPVSESSKPEVSTPSSKPSPKTAVPVAPVDPSEFIISQSRVTAEEPIPEDLLMAFEKNYQSKTTSMNRSLLVLFILLGVSFASWYFIKQNTTAWTSFKQRLSPTSIPATKQPPIVAMPVQPEQKKPMLQPAVPAISSVLPSFVPKEKPDSSYSIKNPGWERYVGKEVEVRLFKSGTSIKAVQVLSVKGKVLPEVFLKSVLNELFGSAEYKVKSSETKSGILLLRGTVAEKANIIIYRKKRSMLAFVVSFN